MHGKQPHAASLKQAPSKPCPNPIERHRRCSAPAWAPRDLGAESSSRLAGRETLAGPPSPTAPYCARRRAAPLARCLISRCLALRCAPAPHLACRVAWLPPSPSAPDAGTSARCYTLADAPLALESQPAGIRPNCHAQLSPTRGTLTLRSLETLRILGAQSLGPLGVNDAFSFTCMKAWAFAGSACLVLHLCLKSQW